MKTKQIPRSLFGVRCSTFDVPLTLLLLFAATGSALAAEVHTQLAAHTTANPSANRSAPIPVDQLGAVAGQQYHGDGLSVSATPAGARLRCVLQRLEGEATREGLWLTSTVTNATTDRFRVVAADVRRLTSTRTLQRETRNALQSLLTSAATDQGALPRTGTVSVEGQLVRFTRPRLVEEYTVSLDGVRQDFIIEQPPLNAQPSILNHHELVVRLAVSGASVEPAVSGVQLVLENSGRKIAYSRLRVTDATGKELPARIELEAVSEVAVSRQSAADVETEDGGVLPSRRYAWLKVVVDDAEAVYPIRIDPTFSDANWMSMNPGIPGANGGVRAAVTDGLGNLYIGGWFSVVGDVIANRIAKWNGSSWSALGSGMNDAVLALAVSGSDLYAGGFFTTAGGSAANAIAKWNGSSWSALGSGISGDEVPPGESPSVRALAVSASDLYVGGLFARAGGKVSPYIARAYLLPLPMLSVLRSGPDVRVSWPAADTAGFALEQAGTLTAPPSWFSNTASVTDDGTNKSVTLPATNSAQFFRLRRL